MSDINEEVSIEGSRVNMKIVCFVGVIAIAIGIAQAYGKQTAVIETRVTALEERYDKVDEFIDSQTEDHSDIKVQLAKLTQMEELKYKMIETLVEDLKAHKETDHNNAGRRK